MKHFFSEKIKELVNRVRKITQDDIEPRAGQVDQKCAWPKHTFDVLKKEGFMGLHVPLSLGGHEEGLLALASITEQIAQGCTSSAISYAMHCVGTAVIAAKATPFQEENYLKPIAQGKHITTLALSESGTGSHFYFPQTKLNQDGSSFLINGTKQYVTNGGFADSYVISTQISDGTKNEQGVFNCLLLDNNTEGLKWLEPWQGFGMRGNSSRGLELKNTKVPQKNLLGREGEQTWFIFEIVAPYFLIGMAGTYLGVAQAAYDIAEEHLKSRKFAHSGESLSEVQALQMKISELWAEVQKTRGLVYEAALLGDRADEQALVTIMNAKVEASDAAVNVCNEAMTLCGGKAYRENSKLARLLRDARASHVMAPTTTILRTWAGRALLGLPVL